MVNEVGKKNLRLNGWAAHYAPPVSTLTHHQSAASPRFIPIVLHSLHVLTTIWSSGVEKSFQISSYPVGCSWLSHYCAQTNHVRRSVLRVSVEDKTNSLHTITGEPSSPWYSNSSKTHCFTVHWSSEIIFRRFPPLILLWTQLQPSGD